jgi:hypothetical protein
MIKYTLKGLNAEQQAQQLKKLPSLYKRLEGLVTATVVVYLILFMALHVIYKKLGTEPAATQIIACLLVLANASALAVFICNKFVTPLSNAKKISAIKTGQVEIITIKTSRAIKRADFDDFGSAFYIDVTDKNRKKTLFLWGQYLDEGDCQNNFPNTEFEIIRQPGSDEFMSFRLLGQHFTEEKTLPPFDKKIWQTGAYPVNGDLLDQSIDEIT